MREAIVGSRDYFPLSDVDDYVDTLPLDTIVVSGRAPGVDQRAENRARQRGMQVESIPADWTKLGIAAGMIRNVKVVEISDKVTAFWDLKSRGTAHTIMLAEAQGKLAAVKISCKKAVQIATLIRGGKKLPDILL